MNNQRVRPETNGAGNGGRERPEGVLAPTESDALAALEHFTVANNFDPVVTGLAHAQPNATAMTVDRSKAWEAFGTGDHDWVPTSDRAGLALVNKGDMAVGGGNGEGVKIIPAGPNKTVRISDSTSIYGYSDTADPELASVTAPLKTALGTPTNVPVVGAAAVATRGRYTACANTQVSIIDCISPSAPVLLANNNVLGGGSTRKLAWVGDVIWALRSDGNLQLLNAKNPKAITAFTGGNGGVLSVGGSPRGMDVFGDYAAITSPNGSGNNLFIVDGSNRASPSIISQTALGDYFPFSVRVHGKLLVVILRSLTVAGQTYPGALKVMDLSDLSAPASITGGNSGVVACPENATGLEVENGIAYVATYSSGGATRQKFYTISLRDPATPVVLGSIGLSPGLQLLSIAGTKAFVPSYSDGKIHVIDCADLSNPVEIGTAAVAASNPLDTAVGQGFVAVANSGNNTCGIFPITSRVEADFARFGRARVQNMHIEGNAYAEGNVGAAGYMSARGFHLDNPPVFATGASHTVDELIAVLQALGTLRQS